MLGARIIHNMMYPSVPHPLHSQMSSFYNRKMPLSTLLQSFQSQKNLIFLLILKKGYMQIWRLRLLVSHALADKNTKPSDLGRPGHINPLRARNGGVLVRAGHTEAAVDLARLAGLYPAGALIEIINEDV